MAGVFTQQDKPKNRGMKMQPPPVKVAAQAHGIPVFQPKSWKGEEAYEQLRALEPELVVVTAYGQAAAPAGAGSAPVWLHQRPRLAAARLPGGQPHPAGDPAGRKQSGVTIMQMDEGLDTGDMLLRRAIDLAPDETADSLHDKLAALGAGLLVECVEKLEKGEITPEPQPEACRFYAPLIRKEDGHIHFTEQAEQIDRMARGLQPWPGTFSHLGGQTIKLFGYHSRAGRPFGGNAARSWIVGSKGSKWPVPMAS